ncbi:MAG: hypothetical protein HYX84_09130 [Chloroflexi bacterium]|nr:hypothetical protein [Chloroflexota bacterium]
MRQFFGVILSVIATLTVPASVLANGGDVHVGEFHIPSIVTWIGGGAILIVILLFLISWMASRKSRQRSREADEQT